MKIKISDYCTFDLDIDLIELFEDVPHNKIIEKIVDLDKEMLNCNFTLKLITKLLSNKANIKHAFEFNEVNEIVIDKSVVTEFVVALYKAIGEIEMAYD